MDQPGPYQHPSHHRQIFSTQQLPPPSQLHLPINNNQQQAYARPNTLPPPIPNLAPARYPPPNAPPSYGHPNLAPANSSSSHTLPPIPSSSGSGSSSQPWPTHRTSSSREEHYPGQGGHPPPSRQRSDSSLSTKGKAMDVDREPPKEQPSEDNMPPTSDFVKKLYKCVSSRLFDGCCMVLINFFAWL